MFVHVGQAGCQLAQALWPALTQERANSPDLFSHRAAPRSLPCPRAVLVDGESKVVEAALAASRGGTFAFDPASAAWSQTGRGGNFALGYAGNGGPMPVFAAPGRQPELVGQALECVRRQVEGCHGTHTGTVLTHSLGGGTGSGLGSRLAEEVRDEMPKVPLLSVSILPLSMGENPAQCFNALLALATLQEVTDGILLYENDRLLQTMALNPPRRSATNPQGAMSAIQQEAPGSDLGASLMAMNSLITCDLAPLLCPPSASHPFDVGDLLAASCPMPTHRFLQAVRGEAAGVNGLLPELKPALEALSRASGRSASAPRSSAQRPGHSAGGAGCVLAAHTVVRGAQVTDSLKVRTEVLDRLGGATAWQAGGVDLRWSATPLRSAPSSVRVSALVNWLRVAPVLRGVTGQARQKYAGRAFVHWYGSHGFEACDFEHAFEVLDTAVADYEAA